MSNNENNASSGKDISFDNIANKFDKNIYGSTKGRLRQQLLLHRLHPVWQTLSPGAYVLDAGGGTGEFTRALLTKDYEVLLNDISQDTLDVAAGKLSSYDRISYHCGSIQSLETPRDFEFIVCHAVLEWLEKPQNTIHHLWNMLAPGGYLSLSFFNQDANLFGNLVYGNFQLIKNNMQQKNRLRLASHRPLKPQDVISWLHQLPCDIVQLSGIRCFHDYLRDKSQQESCYEELLEMEIKYGASEPFMWLGKYFHVLVKKHN